MIEATGGVVAATSTSLTIRVPFAIGVVCNNAGTNTHVSLLPVDSMTYAKAGFYGYAWRNFTTGVYTYVEGGVSEATAPDQSVCTGVNITTVPGGKVITLSPVLNLAQAGLGTPVFLYAKVRYEFKASTAIPGMTGLYRTQIAPNGAETTEELVAPFANTASWSFFTLNGGNVAQAAAPAPLSNIVGLELHLDGLSESRSVGMTNKESAPFTTAVFFKNRTN
jgi:hypothetical protein